MNKKYFALLISFSLALTACDGGTETEETESFSIGGTVSGLSGTVVLQNNGADDLSISADGTFSFAAALESGAAYAVTVFTQPEGQNCVVDNATGTVADADVNNVQLTCADEETNLYTVGGNLSGLVGSLVLQNNGGNDLTLLADGNFSFSTSLDTGAAYLVTVLSEPAEQSCVVENGTGSIADANINDVSVTCASARCRNYASEYTDNDGKTTLCSFDEESFRLTCDKEGSKSFLDYESVEAFIDGAQVVGRIRYLHRSYSVSPTAWDYNYDDQDRLTGFDQVNRDESFQHFDSWDEQGRPKSGIGSISSTCFDYGVSFAYDNLLRTSYRRYSGTEISGCDSVSFYHARDHFDQYGNLIQREAINMQEDPAWTDNYTIVSTTEICR